MAQHMLALVVAAFASKVSAQSSTMGSTSCPCLDEYPENTGVQYECNEVYASGGMCVNATPKSTLVPYPGDYGLSCKTFKEPGHPSCWNLDTGLELPSAIAGGRRLNASSNDSTESTTDGNATKKAAWCDEKWCYVDPCQCDASDVSVSTYFKGKISYSYSTCDSEDKYTKSETTVQMGESKCESQDASAAFSRGFLQVVGVLAASMLIIR